MHKVKPTPPNKADSIVTMGKFSSLLEVMGGGVRPDSSTQNEPEEEKIYFSLQFRVTVQP